MAGSRRKYKRSKPKVRVGLPNKKAGVFKPAFDIPPALLTSAPLSPGEPHRQWDDKGSVIRNYRSFGVVANPNILGVRARTPHIVQSSDLQVPNSETQPVSELDAVDSGSDIESEDLKYALGKKRKDGGTALLKPLTAIQRLHVSRLIEKYGDDYQAMFMDTKLNTMQHSVATLRKLCERYPIQKQKHYIKVR